MMDQLLSISSKERQSLNGLYYVILCGGTALEG
jgi:hypothetical protein